MPTEVARKPTKWLEHQVDESINEKSIIVTPELVPNSIKPQYDELKTLRIMAPEFQEILHAASFEADGMTKKPSTAQMIEEEIMSQMILPMPIKTPPLLAMLVSMDPDLRAATPRFLSHTPATVVYSSLSIFLVYMMRSRAVTQSGEKHRYLCTETKERIEDALKGLGKWARDSLEMSVLTQTLTWARKSEKVSRVSELDLSKFYNQVAVEQGLKAVHQYIYARIAIIELAIIACLGIHPRDAAKEGLISSICEPNYSEVGKACREAVSDAIDAIVKEDGAPYSNGKLYPLPTRKMLEYGIPTGFFHEALCIFFSEM